MRVASLDTSASGSMPWRRMIETGMPCVSSKMAENRSSGLDRVAAAAAGVQQGQLEQQLGRRRDAQLAPGRGRQQPKMLFERLQDLVWIQLQVVHHLRRRCPTRPGRRPGRGARWSAAHGRVGGHPRARDPRRARPSRPACSAGCRSPPRQPPAYRCTWREQDGGQPACRPSIQPMPVNCLTPNEKERIARGGGWQREATSGGGSTRRPLTQSGQRFLPRWSRAGPGCGASVGGWLLKSDIKPGAGERLDDEHVGGRRVGVERNLFRRRRRSSSAPRPARKGCRRSARRRRPRHTRATAKSPSG